jgi:alkanesulfonate monooxygenase SsuD/methylene tetrahydromethanopterin reductase-like flavin-dependent oxidoreductase (luciferase family)
MQLGMQTGASVWPGITYEEAVDQLTWQARFADEAGFKRLWLVEHHFVDFAMSGAPSTILAHYASITQRIKLGYAVAVLPLHHPVRLAEEMAWLDQLSKGRMMLGIGPGFSPLEYGVFGVEVERKREYVEESFRILKLALSGEPFTYDGAIWKIPPIQIHPGPYRGRRMPFYMATSSHDPVARAARWDVSPLLGFRPIEVLKDQIKLWRSVRAELGDTPEEIDRKQKEIGVLRRIVVGNTEEEAATVAAAGSLQFAEAIRRLNTAAGESKPRAFEALGPDGRRVLVQDVNEEDQRARSAQNATAGTIAGTKSHVIEQLYELQETGVGHVLAGFGGRGVPHREARANLEMIASDILPLFND